MSGGNHRRTAFQRTTVFISEMNTGVFSNTTRDKEIIVLSFCNCYVDTRCGQWAFPAKLTISVKTPNDTRVNLGNPVMSPAWQTYW